MLKIRRPLGRLIFNMGIAIPGKTVFLIETTPWVFINRKYQCCCGKLVDTRLTSDYTALDLRSQVFVLKNGQVFVDFQRCTAAVRTLFIDCAVNCGDENICRDNIFLISCSEFTLKLWSYVYLFSKVWNQITFALSPCLENCSCGIGGESAGNVFTWPVPQTTFFVKFEIYIKYEYWNLTHW